LNVDPTAGSEFTAAQLAQNFPNLEFLKMNLSFQLTESSFIELLSGLKRLKTLQMSIQSDSKLESEFILQCFEKFGKHLETVHVKAVEDRDPLHPYGVIGFRIDKEPNEDFRFDQIFDEMDYYWEEKL
jgi:hypothetical protein